MNYCCSSPKLWFHFYCGRFHFINTLTTKNLRVIEYPKFSKLCPPWKTCKFSGEEQRMILLKKLSEGGVTKKPDVTPKFGYSALAKSLYSRKVSDYSGKCDWKISDWLFVKIYPQSGADELSVKYEILIEKKVGSYEILLGHVFQVWFLIEEIKKDICRIEILFQRVLICVKIKIMFFKTWDRTQFLQFYINLNFLKALASNCF